MAQPDDATQTRGRVPLLVGLLAFAAATAIAFGRVYRGPGSTLRLVLAAVAAVLLAVLLERWHVLLATLASAAGLVLALAWLVFPHTLAFGLPTGATLEGIGRAFAEVGTAAAQHVAPVDALPSLLLAGVVAVWTAAFAAHALVARAGSGVLALLPAGALVGFADVVLEDGVRPAYMVLFLLAAFAMLSTLGLRAAVRWGRLVPWSGARRWSLFSVNALRAARRAAIPAALSAVLLPWLIPGLHAPGWYDIGGSGSQITIDPIVDLRPSLRLDPPRELFTVSSPKPTYWRMLALDEFDGRRWSTPDLRVVNGAAVDGGTTLPTNADQGVPYRTLEVTVNIDRLASPWLPLPFEPVYVDVPVDGVRWDADLSTLAVPEFTERDLEYRATGFIANPQPSQLDVEFAGDDPLYLEGSRFTRLPADTPPQLLEIAQQITEDAPTPYRKTLAIQDHLYSFKYDERARPGHESDYLIQFLTETKAGYCEQFAGAMAVLLRALNIPARVVVGFNEGTFRPQDKRWHVTTRNAHSWVEVHFGEFGWLPFEPTPGESNPTATGFTFPILPSDGSGNPTDPRVDNTTPQPRGNQADQGGIGPGETPEPIVAPSLIALVAGLVAGGVVLLVAAVPAAKAISRRRVLGRAREPRARVLAIHEVLSRRLADLGLARGPSETLWEFRDRLRDRVELPEGSLERLTRLVGRAAYAGAPVPPEQVEEVSGLAEALARGARRGAERRQRLLAPWRMRGLGRVPASAVRRRFSTPAGAWSAARL